MSYTALYRRFRPGTFDEVQGQEHITTTLRNQIKTERIGHAYLFCGTRGTGKTTVAKIMARAINCHNTQNGDPCGECPSCKAIAAGTNTDVTEMDAASNNGVDDMRSIIEEVGYTPAMSRYRVYIVDEVHMLSTSAFNAFLKTLEEPPSHAVFILATTDPQKLPATILSRCQRYDFHRMSPATIVSHLKSLLEIEGVEAQDTAVSYIARAADGSMRDALSILEQCIAFHQGNSLTYESVLEVLGAVDTEVFGRILSAIADGDPGECINILDDMVFRGREITQFVTDFTGYLRDILIFGGNSQGGFEAGMVASDMERLKADALKVDQESLIGFIREFSALSEQIRYANMKRVLVDVALIKLCRHGGQSVRTDGADVSALKERILSLEQKVRELERRPGVSAPAPNQTNTGASSAKEGVMPKVVLPKAVPDDLKPLAGKWRQIISQMPSPAKFYLSGASLTIDDNGGLILAFNGKDKLGFFLQMPENEENLKNIITGIIKKSFEIRLTASSDGMEAADEYPSIFDKIDGIEMEIEVSEDDEGI